MTGTATVLTEWGARRPAGPAARCGCGVPDAVPTLRCGPYLARAHAAPGAGGRSPCPPGLPLVDEHLRVRLDAAADPRWTGCADVLHRDRPPTAGTAAGAAERVLRAHPGCLLASVRVREGGCAAAARDGRRFTLAGPPLTAQEHAWLASFLHGWVVCGIQPAPGGSPRLLIRSRSRAVSLGLTVR